MSEVALETTDKHVAMQKLKEIVSEKEKERAGLLAPKIERESATRPLKDHLDDFLADLKVKGRALRYCRGVEGNVSRLTKACKWKFPGDIRADDFVQWRSKQTIRPKTLNEYLNAMNTFLNWMEKHERIGHQPLRKVEKVDIRGKQQLRRALTDEEFDRLLEVAGIYRLLYLTAVYTGLRKGELTGLVEGNIKLKHAQPHIHVPAHLTKNRTQAIVPLHPMLVEELQKELQDKTEMDFVFPQRSNTYQFLDEHLKKAGIEKIDASGRKVDFHSFRYTFATKLARKGVSQRLTQELMRHSDPRLTANLYTDVSHLPTFEVVQDLKWVKTKSIKPEVPKSDLSITWTHIGTQNTDAYMPFVSQSGTNKTIRQLATDLDRKGKSEISHRNLALIKWYPEQESNLHTLRHVSLNHTCLPIPPPGH